MKDSQPNTDYVQPLTALGCRAVGRMRTRLAKDIESSPWSIGCETIDRWMVDFSQTGPHLGELGAKAARVQAGWARCEPVPGTYDWPWLDEIVDGCVRQGVRPWLETSYGNPVYPGGGGIGLAEGIPTSSESLAAWDRWVTALTQRYADRVDTWEIWNEPDIHDAVSGGGYTAFFIRTAPSIRQVQSRARIVGLALAGNLEFAADFLRRLNAAQQTQLLDEVSFHFYPHNPDSDFDHVAKLGALVKQYAPHATLRQGETGAPAETRQFMALGNHEWSERKQAVWDLRRLLAHHARGIPMSLFQLADMQYTKEKGKFEGRNPKGMLCINPDKTVAYRRPVYFAAQHVFSLFDNRFPLRPLEPLPVKSDRCVAAYAWQLTGQTVPALVAWWDASDAPGPETPALSSIGLPAPTVADPVLLDFLSGTIFELPANMNFECLPCADSPFALVGRNLIKTTHAS